MRDTPQSAMQHKISWLSDYYFQLWTITSDNGAQKRLVLNKCADATCSCYLEVRGKISSLTGWDVTQEYLSSYAILMAKC